MTSEFLLIGNEIERRRININSILYVKTEDYLSTFFLANSQKFICSKTLREIAYCLPDHFFQINKSCVVNLKEIVSVKRGTRKIILSNSSELIVSMRRMKALNDVLTNQSVAFAS